MFTIESLKKRAEQELEQVKQVPASLFLMLLAGFGGGWYVNDLFHAERFAVMEQRLAQTDAQQDRLKAPEPANAPAATPERTESSTNATPPVVPLKGKSPNSSAVAKRGDYYATFEIPKPAVDVKWLRSQDGTYFFVISTRAKEGLSGPTHFGFSELRLWEPSLKEFMKSNSVTSVDVSFPSPFGSLSPDEGETLAVPAKLLAALNGLEGIRRMTVYVNTPEINEEVKQICVDKVGNALQEVKCPVR